MDLATVKEIMREFKACELTKLELKYDNTQIKLEKKKEVIMSPSVKQVPEYEELPVAAPSCATIIPAQITPEVKPQSTGCAIVSPMVGTIYTAPDPDSEDFMKLGKMVKKGDVVCIIEAMKLMNEVEAEIDGEVIEILVKNEQMVEFGEPLFIIEPKA